MRITGDNAEGKAQLDNFIDEDSTYPVIAVTSKLMTTGVDAKMCKLIVLDNNINSMTEFKQIIGRGTRLLEDYGKTYFTIMDFRNASRLFADKDFDGNPEVVIDITGDDPVDPVTGNKDDTENTGDIEYEDISLVDATTGMVLPQHVAATDSSMAMMAEVACAGTTYQVAATEDTVTTFGDWTVEDGSEYPMVTYYEIKETYKVTAPAEYKGLLFVLQTQRSAEEYENGIVKGLGTDEAHTFDGTINDGSVAIELDRDYEYINEE